MDNNAKITQTNAPQIVDNVQNGSIYGEEAKVGLKIGSSLPKEQSEAMLQRLAYANQVAKEKRDAGLIKTSAQKFIDNPRPMRAIRRFCYECCGFSSKMAWTCNQKSCALWLFRHGTGVINEKELAPWQTAYTKWMRIAGENIGYLKKPDDNATMIDDAEI